VTHLQALGFEESKLTLKAKLVLMLIVVKLDIAITELSTTKLAAADQVIEPNFEFGSLMST